MRRSNRQPIQCEPLEIRRLLTTISSGTIGSAGTTTTNTSTLIIAPAAGQTVKLAGTLDNQGTIVLQGAGSLDFGKNAVLRNEAGALFDIAADTDIECTAANGTPRFINAGTLRKTGGTGVSAFLSTGGSAVKLNDAGVIDAESGTLTLGLVVQISGTTIGGGVYMAGAGATLNLPPSNIAANQGTLILNGTGSRIPQIDRLTSNAGSLSVTGDLLSIAGSLSNSGTITLGPAGSMSVNGSYSQTGRLTVQIGGAAITNAYGKLSVSGAASLGGTLHLTLLDQFLPTPGDSFAVAHYASHTGDFAVASGNPAWYGEQTGAGSVIVNDITNGTATLGSTGLLTLDGTRNNDSISLKLIDGQDVATINGVATRFNPADVQFILVNAGPGADGVHVGAGLDPAIVQGAAGADTLVARNENDTLIGGGGGDSIRSIGGHDQLLGGNGNDTLLSANGIPDTLDGGAGTNSGLFDSGQDTVTNIQNVQ